MCLPKSKVKGARAPPKQMKHKCFANGKPRNKKTHNRVRGRERESVCASGNETNTAKWHKCKQANNKPSSIAPNTQRHHFSSFHAHRSLGSRVYFAECTGRDHDNGNKNNQQKQQKLVQNIHMWRYRSTYALALLLASSLTRTDSF